jgi:hypothetical protein
LLAAFVVETSAAPPPGLRETTDVTLDTGH